MSSGLGFEDVRREPDQPLADLARRLADRTGTDDRAAAGVGAHAEVRGAVGVAVR